MLEILNCIIGFMFIAVVFIIVVCLIYVICEAQRKRKRSKYWDEEHEKGQEYKAALKHFKLAEAECTVAKDDICDNKCGDCDISDQCVFNKRG